jgi:uncharacterized protein
MNPVLSDTLFERGLQFFNAGDYYECHEAWEDHWMPLRNPRRWFVQSLIHFAVAFYHDERRNSPGAEKQLEKGLRKLAGYLPRYEGFDTLALYQEGQRCLACVRRGQSIGRYPRIERKR